MPTNIILLLLWMKYGVQALAILCINQKTIRHSLPLEMMRKFDCSFVSRFRGLYRLRTGYGFGFCGYSIRYKFASRLEWSVLLCSF